MWHLIYIVAFALLAFLAIGNLIRNMMMLGTTASRPQGRQTPGAASPQPQRPVPHPELLDAEGNVIREPLLVMRSISVNDAREQLDALYDEGTRRDEAEDGDAS